MKKLIILILTLVLLSACSYERDDNKINITATTTMISDLINQVGKDRVQVYGMMREGVDPHSYKARPSDVMAIDNADIIAFNGINLEAKLADVFDSLAESGQFLIKLEEGINPDDLLVVDDSGAYDPHIWFNVGIWKDSAIYVAQQLIQYEPESKDYFEANLKDYLSELNALEAYIINEIDQISPNQRVLVTAHDAFTYFGEAYDVEVLAVQGINSQSEAGIKDINNLSKRIIDSNIRSVYSESSVPIKTIEALVSSVRSQGHELNIGGELYSDSLKENTSYIETFKENIDTIVEGLK